jgi:hypothetical protein
VRFRLLPLLFQLIFICKIVLQPFYFAMQIISSAGASSVTSSSTGACAAAASCDTGTTTGTTTAATGTTAAATASGTTAAATATGTTTAATGATAAATGAVAKFLRIGRAARVHPSLQEYTVEAVARDCTNCDQLAQLFSSYQVN